MPEQHTGMPLVSEDWTRALAVVAHPDDLEYGMASAIARWTRQGKQIGYLLATSGEAGIDTLPPDRSAVLRQEEQRRSAALVGVESVEFLSHPDERWCRAWNCGATSRPRSGGTSLKW